MHNPMCASCNPCLPSPESPSLNASAAAGYPGDKPSGTLWQSTCSDVTILSQGTGFLSALSDCTNGGCDNIIKHTCLSSDGQSGSGMWDVNNLQHAILTGKVGPSCMADGVCCTHDELVSELGIATPCMPLGCVHHDGGTGMDMDDLQLVGLTKAGALACMASGELQGIVLSPAP